MKQKVMKRKYYIPILIVCMSMMLFRCEIEKPDPPNKEGNKVSLVDPVKLQSGFREIEVKTDINKHESQNITQHGHFWSRTNEYNPDLPTKTRKGAYRENDDESFTDLIEGLDPTTTYYIWGYAEYGDIVIYSSRVEMNTNTMIEPDANFTVDQTMIGKGSVLIFESLSTNDPESWEWDFGDGNTSTLEDPTHIYNELGIYTVTLKVSNYAGSDTKTETNYITVTGETGTVTDIDGNVYKTVRIGDQVWMAENLKTTHYSDGEEITYGQEVNNEGQYTSKYYFENNVDEYGRLYTWAAVMNGSNSSNIGIQGICPTGWHVPSDNEWKELEVFLGMSQTDADADYNRGTTEGGMLKEKGTSHWWPPNTGATNEVGFSARGAADRYPGPEPGFNGLGAFTNFWTCTALRTDVAWTRGLGHNNSTVFRYAHTKHYGFSVRCVMD